MDMLVLRERSRRGIHNNGYDVSTEDSCAVVQVDPHWQVWRLRYRTVLVDVRKTCQTLMLRLIGSHVCRSVVGKCCKDDPFLSTRLCGGDPKLCIFVKQVEKNIIVEGLSPRSFRYLHCGALSLHLED